MAYSKYSMDQDLVTPEYELTEEELLEAIGELLEAIGELIGDAPLEETDTDEEWASSA